MTQAATPRPPRTRRRGADFENALYAATLAELAEHGYGALSMDGVATRARTGKAALYRRWSGKHELVLSALQHAMPSLSEPDLSQSVRENLRAMLATLGGVPAGETPLPWISVTADLLREPDLRASFAEEFVAPRLQAIEAVLRHGVDTGELDPAMLGPLAARIGPALILQTVLLTGKPPTSRDLDRIVDTVLPRPNGSPTP
jgi:AcrR family transcriptional regulator